ncbi:RNA chaperone Hfq [Saccharibacillus sp. CPCC 101409]|uniref:RNA chaperone Hfq n=1 Tax=Saccharibacillus sp. CPCC 101409 TaxID=3058041 RepID=UPI0026729A8D|nr:RNA chaperone Hfq [Saccharibacillus sp. CPCC 101409]MDO3412430.1 RNA chaperone Hfq [Saccharibacillus sp. CPCC 101409]
MNSSSAASDFGQDRQLNKLLQDRTDCTIITVNGVQLRGVIEMFDKYVVLLRGSNGLPNMIYKHAISTVRSNK